MNLEDEKEPEPFDMEVDFDSENEIPRSELNQPKQKIIYVFEDSSDSSNSDCSLNYDECSKAREIHAQNQLHKERNSVARTIFNDEHSTQANISLHNSSHYKVQLKNSCKTSSKVDSSIGPNTKHMGFYQKSHRKVPKVLKNLSWNKRNNEEMPEKGNICDDASCSSHALSTVNNFDVAKNVCQNNINLIGNTCQIVNNFLLPSKERRVPISTHRVFPKDELYISKIGNSGNIDFPARFKATVMDYARKHGTQSTAFAFYVPEETIQQWLNSSAESFNQIQTKACSDWETNLFIALMRDELKENVLLTDWLDSCRNVLRKSGKDESIITEKWAKEWCQTFCLELRKPSDIKMDTSKKKTGMRKKYIASYKLQVVNFAETHSFNTTSRVFGVSPRCISSWVKSRKKLIDIVQEGGNKFRYRTIIKKPPLQGEFGNCLFEWYEEMTSRGMVIHRSAIMTKAKILARTMGIESFTGSYRWYISWVNTYLKRGYLNKNEERHVLNQNGASDLISDASEDGYRTASILSQINNEQNESVLSTNNNLSVIFCSLSEDTAAHQSPVKSKANLYSKVEMEIEELKIKNCPTVVEKSNADETESNLRGSLDVVITESVNETGNCNGNECSQDLCPTVKSTLESSKTAPNIVVPVILTKRTCGEAYSEDFKALVACYAYENGIGMAAECYDVDSDVIKTWCWSRKYVKHKNGGLEERSFYRNLERKGSSLEKHGVKNTADNDNLAFEHSLLTCRTVSEEEILLKRCSVSLEKESIDRLLKQTENAGQQTFEEIMKKHRTPPQQECSSPLVSRESNRQTVVVDDNYSSDTSWHYSDEYSSSDSDNTEAPQTPVGKMKGKVSGRNDNFQFDDVNNIACQLEPKQQCKLGKQLQSGITKEGQRYSKEFKKMVAAFASDTSCQEAAKVYGIHCSTVAEWAKERRKKIYAPSLIEKVKDNSAGGMLIKFLQNINERKHLLTSRELLEEADRIVRLKGRVDNKQSDWFYNWYNYKIERTRLLENDDMNSYLNLCRKDSRIHFPNAFKLEIIKYSERAKLIEITRCFQIRRELISSWKKNRDGIEKLVELGRKRLTAVKSKLDKTRAMAKVEIFNWYKGKVSKGIIPKFREVQQHALRVYLRYGVTRNFTVSRGWFHKFCVQFNIELRYADDNSVLEWLLQRLEQNQRVTHREVRTHALEVIRQMRPDFVGSYRWVFRFYKRHWDLLLTFPSIEQPLPPALETRVVEFRQHIKDLHAQHNFGHSSIGSMDEVPISFIPSSDHDLPMRNCGLRNCQAVVLLACLMDGGLLPPLILLKKDGPVDCGDSDVIFYQDEVSVDPDIVRCWLSRVWLANVPTPNLLLLDSFAPHCSSEVTSFMRDCNIVASIIPGGCTSKLHPVAVGLRKEFEKTVITLWKERLPKGRPIPSPQEIITLVNNAVSTLQLRTEVIRRSFRVTGVSDTFHAEMLDNSSYLMNSTS